MANTHLEKIVNEIKSHIKDTTDYSNKIETITDLPENTIVVTMDVKSLFTNIPNIEGINAVAKALENQTDLKIPTRVIIKFLYLTLILNNFSFNVRHTPKETILYGKQKFVSLQRRLHA